MAGGKLRSAGPSNWETGATVWKVYPYQFGDPLTPRGVDSGVNSGVNQTRQDPSFSDPDHGIHTARRLFGGKLSGSACVS